MTPRTLIAVFALAAILPLASACNTIEGFGQDLETAGEIIQDEAEE